MTAPKMRRYYFQIPSANIFECIWAASLTDAKSKAAVDWLEYWHEIQWLNIDTVTEAINCE